VGSNGIALFTRNKLFTVTYVHNEKCKLVTRYRIVLITICSNRRKWKKMREWMVTFTCTTFSKKKNLHVYSQRQSRTKKSVCYYIWIRERGRGKEHRWRGVGMAVWRLPTAEWSLIREVRVVMQWWCGLSLFISPRRRSNHSTFVAKVSAAGELGHGPQGSLGSTASVDQTR